MTKSTLRIIELGGVVLTGVMSFGVGGLAVVTGNLQLFDVSIAAALIWIPTLWTLRVRPPSLNREYKPWVEASRRRVDYNFIDESNSPTNEEGAASEQSAGASADDQTPRSRS